MRINGTCALLLILLASGSLAFPLEPGSAASKKITYDGLTGTIANLLRTREIPKVVLGSYGYAIEDFIDDDINELYSCDAQLSEYLDSYDSCNYEQFSAIIEESILAALDDKSAYAHVFVAASEEGNRVSLSISIEYAKNLLLPVYLETVNGEVKASFTIPSAIQFDVSMNLGIDSDTVLSDGVLRGASIGIDRFALSLSSYEDEWNGVATVLFGNYLRGFSVQESRVNVEQYWHLCDKDGYSLEDGALTYEQLCDGEYSWVLDSTSEVAIAGRASAAEDEGEDDAELSYSSGDLVEQTPYRVRLSDAEGSRDLDIRRLAF